MLESISRIRSSSSCSSGSSATLESSYVGERCCLTQSPRHKSALRGVQVKMENNRTSYVDLRTGGALEDIGGSFLTRVVTVKGALSHEEIFGLFEVSGLVKLTDFRSQLPSIDILHYLDNDDLVSEAIADCGLDGNEYLTEQEFSQLLGVLEATNKRKKQLVMLQGEDLKVSVQSSTAWHNKPSHITTTSNTNREDDKLMSPDDAFRRWWDVFITIKMLYYWVTVTLVLLFLDTYSDTILAMDVFWVFVQYIDIAVRLNTVTEYEMKLIRDRRSIFKAYIVTCFASDLIQGFPLDLIVYGGRFSVLAWKLCRFKYLISLKRFPSMLKIPDMSPMGPALVEYYFILVPVLRKVMTMFFIAHVLIISRMLISHNEKSHAEANCTVPDACPASLHGHYLYSAFYNWAVLTTQGPIVYSLECTLFAGLMCLMCLLLQGHVMAEMSAIMVTGNIEEQNNDYMRKSMAIMFHFGVPPSLQQEVLSFNYHTLGGNSCAILKQSLTALPSPIIREVFLYIKVTVIEAIPMFHDLGLQCTLALANCLDHKTANPDEALITYGSLGKEMYVLMYGHADVLVPCGGAWKSLTILARGELFGELALLRPHAPRSATVRSLSYCDLFVLLTVDFQIVQDSFGDLKERMELEASKRGLLASQTKIELDVSRNRPTINEGRSINHRGSLHLSDVVSLSSSSDGIISPKAFVTPPTPVSTDLNPPIVKQIKVPSFCAPLEIDDQKSEASSVVLSPNVMKRTSSSMRSLFKVKSMREGTLGIGFLSRLVPGSAVNLKRPERNSDDSKNHGSASSTEIIELQISAYHIPALTVIAPRVQQNVQLLEEVEALVLRDIEASQQNLHDAVSARVEEIGSSAQEYCEYLNGFIGNLEAAIAVQQQMPGTPSPSSRKRSKLSFMIN